MLFSEKGFSKYETEMSLRQKVKKPGKRRSVFPYFILIVLLLITVVITFNFYRSAVSKDQIRFANEVSRAQAAFQNRLNLYISLLKGGRGFVESVNGLDRNKFANYVRTLEIDKNYSGIQGIGYSKVIRREEAQVLTERLQSEYYENFRMFPDTLRDIFQSIIYLEPLDARNRRALGFDMSSEPTRREALDRARDTGRAAATARIVLLQETDRNTQSGFLIYVPVYKNIEIPDTIEKRQMAIDGFIYSPFRAGEFLAEIEKEASASHIGIAIYDGAIDSNHLLANSKGQVVPTDPANLSDPERSVSYLVDKELEVAGREWIIRYFALPSFEEQSSVGWTPFIFLSGVAFSFLLFGMIYWEASARLKLEATAAELFELEKQKQTLLENERIARVVAETANATKDEFLSVVSHELRTPLNAIAGWSRILRTEPLSQTTRELALAKIDKNVRVQTKIVEDLLDYSQILAGNTSLERSEIEIGKIIDDQVTNIEVAAFEKQINLTINNSFNGQVILGDERKVALAVENLFTNAIKFTESNGNIAIDAFEEDGYANVVVKDDGRGIVKEFLPHVFESFRQADNSTTRNVGGLGLGLTIASQIVKLHDGEISVSSEGRGKGSVFTIKLPVKDLN